MFENIILGFSTALQFENLSFSLLGVVIGNLLGILPGIGPLAALSMLLPVTYGLSPTAAIMMLAGLFYGTTFGGATTSILLNLPGTSSHAVVCLDGNPLARQGRGGAAIFMAMAASFIGVCLGIVLMMLFSPWLSDVAIMFSAEAYFSLMLLGLLAASTFSTGSPIKAFASILFGLLLGTAGSDITSGEIRFTFGFSNLQDGISLVALALGLFGLSDILRSKDSTDVEAGFASTRQITRRNVRPNKEEVKRSVGPIARGSIMGSFLGILPGAGGTMSSFMSYATELRMSKKPERFGKGAIEGVSGPEAANSSAAITAFVPTLTLGIPGDSVMAIMLGAMMIHNIEPGPFLMMNHAPLFWGLLASFWIGNLILLFLNIPLIGIWVRMLSVPYRLVYPLIIVLVCIGVYSSNNNLYDIGTVMGIGVFGYIITKLGFQPASVLLAFVLGPMMEEKFRRATALSGGELSSFITDPISGATLGVCALLIIGLVTRFVRSKLKGA